MITRESLLLRSAAVGVALGSTFASIASGQEVAAPAPPLRILAASIEEPAVELGRVQGRSVTLWLELAEIPECGTGAAKTSYGFLIDADRDPTTGFSRSDLDFGPDARITVSCDDEAGRWSSPTGSVEIVPLPAGSARIEIATTVDRLPAVDFHWAAYAEDGERAYTLPAPHPKTEAGPIGYARWRPFEMTRP